MTQEIANILKPKGYALTCRGTIPVKGKGEMVTYFLEGQVRQKVSPQEISS